jgi:hypothetical protein
MADKTFSAFVTKERSRLNKLRKAAEQRKKAAEADLVQIENELKAITAYENAKRGSPAPKSRKRVRRTGRRAEVLATVKKHADGATRADLLAALKAKGNKSDEQSVSNALAALKKASKIVSKDGRYHAA